MPHLARIYPVGIGLGMRIEDDAKIMKRLDSITKLAIFGMVLFGLMLIGTTCNAQQFNIVENEWNADLKVQIVDHLWDADRVVCIVEKWDIQPKKSWINVSGKWFEGKALWFTEHSWKADERWYITRNKWETTRVD